MVIDGKILELTKGDITDLDVDVIVNAANGYLKLGGGVAGAIRRKGGPEIQKECDTIVARRGAISTGEATITTGGNLKAKYVIHAVGPIYGEGDEDQKLRKAILSSLRLANKYGVKSLAFPAISTGIFGFPKKRAAEIMLSSVIGYLKKEKTGLVHVLFCLFDDETFAIFRETLAKISN